MPRIVNNDNRLIESNVDFKALSTFIKNNETNSQVDLSNIPTFSEDGRALLHTLYERYETLKTFGFTKELIYTTRVKSGNDLVEVPVYAYKSKKRGCPSLWILSGIHGEEPAGPNAIAQEIEKIGEFGKDNGVVVIPLAHLGYIKDDRYPDENRKGGHSIGDADRNLPSYMLSTDRPDINPNMPQSNEITSPMADDFLRYILKSIKEYPPLVTLDLHEDEKLKRSYIYSQGALGADDRVAKKVIAILKQLNDLIQIQTDGFTRFDEPIVEGVVVGPDKNPVKDGSVDQLLAERKYFLDGKAEEKPPALSVLVIETPTLKTPTVDSPNKRVPLENRVKAHAAVLKAIPELWKTAKEQHGIS